VDLDITPTNVFTGEGIYNENGIKAYMAGMYNHLPMEDFMYDTNNGGAGSLGFDGYFNRIPVRVFWVSTGEITNVEHAGDRTLVRHRTGYWSNGFKLIRQANTLIQDLPNYPELSEQSKAWIAEAKFIRAYVYFQLAKRYGGLPKVFEPQMLDTDNESTLWVARESHADTYDFILNDLDEAIADLPAKSDAGRVNKYIAAAIKSRVALHAATTARYGSLKFSDWEVDGVLLQGIPANKANGYFKQSWDAVKMLEGVYQLHSENADKTANYAEIWEKAETNKETIWLRKYDLVNWVHNVDMLYSPIRFNSGAYGNRYVPTLEWVELFDGLPLDANGHFSALDNDGNYIVYNNSRQIWEGIEPRLRANLLIPGETYRGIKLDVRGGVFDAQYDPNVDKFKKIGIDNGSDLSNYRNQWNRTDYPTCPFPPNTSTPGMILYSTTEARNQGNADIYEVDGARIYKNGLDGPKMSWAGGSATATGFYGRKWLDLNKTTSQCTYGQSVQPWVEIRYAEMLLNRAEAAVELAQSGETSYSGIDMLQDAFYCINALRNRAGAVPLTDVSQLSTNPAFTSWNNPGPKGQGGFVEAPNRALQIVRVERYKELNCESKLYWDLLRWFTFDTQIRNYAKRGVYPFLFGKGATVDDKGIAEGKFIYDTKSSEYNNFTISFIIEWFYETIPSNELKNNPLLQKNRNQ
jgi:hypothetical protein